MSKTKGVVKLVVNTDTTVSPQEPDSVKTEDSGLFIHSTNSANASKIWLSQGSATSASFAKLEFDTDFGLKINVNNPIQTSHDASIVFGTRGVDYWEIEGLNGSSGDLLPLTNNTLRIGRSSLNLSNIFSRQLSSDTSLVLATAGSTRWTLDSSGNLIPGTNSQNIGTSDLRLNTIFSNQITSGTNQALFLGSNAGSYRWYIANSTNAALVPNTANAFDLGTSTNRVATTFSVNINNSEAITTGTVNASSGVIADAIQTRTTSSALSFRTGTGYATRVTIDSSGNLGVGTSSPSTRLDVSGVVKSLGVSLSDFNGTANPANPSLHFTNETNTGIYREKANYMSLVAGGQKGLSVDSTSGVALLLVGNGDPVSRFHVADDRFTSVSGITLGTDLNSFVQLYRSGNKTLTVNDRITTVSNGSALSPAYTVGGDSNTGIFSPGPDTWAVSTGGVERFRISSDGTVTISNVIVNNSTSAISSGSATAPAYSFGDDLNTGMFNPGADLLAISTGGVERLRVNASGNVGIGTLTPSSRFHVTGAGVNGGRGTFQSSDNANSVNVVGVNGAGINDSSFLYLEDQTNNALIGLTGTAQTAGHLRFAINSTERMRINSSGNVGIGYTSPSYRLHVNGDFGVSTNAVISAAGAITGASLSTSGNILSQGLVGVGTNSPVSQLHVNASTGNSIIHVTNSTTGGTLSDGVSLVSESGTGDAFVIQRENARLILGTNNTNRFIITGAGNIGVGTIDPSALLHLIGNVGGWSSNNYGKQLYITTQIGGPNPCIGISDSSGGNNWAIGNAAGSINFCQMPAITNSTTPIVERMRIDSSGNVGIGTTSPVFPLHVHTTTGNATLHLTNSTTGTTSADGFSLVSEVTTNDAYVIQRENANLIFRTNNTERLRITSGGNVGVGTNTPSHRVHIVDDVGLGRSGLFVDSSPAANNYSCIISHAHSNVGDRGTFRFGHVSDARRQMVQMCNGNVGIGTSVPASKLHILGSGNTNTNYADTDDITASIIIQSDRPEENRGGQILFAASFGIFAGIKGLLRNGTGPAGDIVLQTRNTTGDVFERMRIAANGNVGIGTNSPASKLHVSSGSGSGEVFIGSTVQSLETGTDNSGAIYFGASPGNPLAPSGAIEASWGNAASPHISIGCPRDGQKTRARFGWDNTIRFYTANAEKVRIDPSGNLGIGVTNPSCSLDVNGVLRLRGGTSPIPAQANNNRKTQTYIAFDSNASANDYALLRQIGGENAIKLSLDFHDDSNDARFCIRSIASATTDDTTTVLDFENGTLTITGQAFKPGGGSWSSIGSDIRVKTNVQPYIKGLAEILQVNPIEYEYNGKANTPLGFKGISIIAQELQPVFPECISTRKDKLEKTDEVETDILTYDSSALIYALINAVKELSAKLDQSNLEKENLEVRMSAIEQLLSNK